MKSSFNLANKDNFTEIKNFYIEHGDGIRKFDDDIINLLSVIYVILNKLNILVVVITILWRTNSVTRA